MENREVQYCRHKPPLPWMGLERRLLRKCRPHLIFTGHGFDKDAFVQSIKEIILRAGFEVKSIHLVEFGENQGFTLVAVIGESHVSFHGFPEREYGECVDVEILYCSLVKDNSPKAAELLRLLKEFFGAEEAVYENLYIPLRQPAYPPPLSQ